MQSIKESAANVAASAVSGIEKTKATVQEKVDRMTAKNPREKEMATERKEERVRHAELHKQEAREKNAAAKMLAKNGGSHSFNAAGSSGMTGDRKVSALSKHNVGPHATTDRVIEGTVKFHPITGTTTTTTTGQNTHAADGANTGYGSA